MSRSLAAERATFESRAPPASPTAVHTAPFTPQIHYCAAFSAPVSLRKKKTETGFLPEWSPHKAGGRRSSMLGRRRPGRGWTAPLRAAAPLLCVAHCVHCCQTYFRPRLDSGMCRPAPSQRRSAADLVRLTGAGRPGSTARRPTPLWVNREGRRGVGGRHRNGGSRDVKEASGRTFISALAQLRQFDAVHGRFGDSDIVFGWTETGQ